MSNLNRLLRYFPILFLLEREGAKEVLEVGCGSKGIAIFWGEKVVGCDIDFTDFSGTERPIDPNLIPVRGNAVALPFRDYSFNYVVCVDVLEHLPPDQRPVAISECIRVSRNSVFIAFPDNTHAVNSDEKIHRYWLRTGVMIPPWLKEHRIYGLPSLSDIEKILYQLPCEWTIEKRNSITSQYWFERLGNSKLMGPYLAAIGDFLAPRQWNWSSHRMITNIARILTRLSLPVLPLVNMPPFYRVFFLIHKNKEC